MGKRGRRDGLSVADGRAAVDAILKLDPQPIFDDSKVTPLPYPGIGKAPDRPPIEMYYVGSEAAYDLFLEFSTGRSNLIVTGPRGFGKTSDMRAVSCLVLKDYAMWSPSDRLVCIWNMEAVLEDLVTELRNALLFTYLFPYKRTKSSNQQEETQEQREPLTEQQEQREPIAEWQEQAEPMIEEQEQTEPIPEDREQAELLEKEIFGISSFEEVLNFIKKRKLEHGEVFHFFVDGWEVMDELNSKAEDVSREHHRMYIQTRLDIVFSEGSQVFRTASAKSHAARTNTTAYVKFKPFNEDQYAAYASESILGKLEDRREDIDFLTGRVPFFLDVLCECCANLVPHLNNNMVLPSNRSLKDTVLEQHSKLLVKDPTSEQVAGLVQDNWDVVKHLFRTHAELGKLQKDIDRIELTSSCYSMEEMGRVDATFFIERDNRFCSAFIERMYIHAFRSKEEKFGRGAWMDYGRYLIKQDYVNWACAGWVVEDVWADAVTRKGAFFGTALDMLTGLELVEFTERPTLRMADMRKAKLGHGWFYKPKLHGLPYVDGVIVYIDMSGKLHIVAVQLTVNVDRHLQSAVLFMSLQYLKLWFPDIDFNSVQLHFIFVGFSKALGDTVTEEDKPSATRKLKGGRRTGVAGYKFTYVPLVQSLKALQREEVQTIEELAERRVMQVPDIPLSVADLHQLNKEELKEVLKEYGLDPKQYKLKADMVTALQNLV